MGLVEGVPPLGDDEEFSWGLEKRAECESAFLCVPFVGSGHP